MLWTRQGRLRGGGKPIASMRENNNDQCQGICEQRDAIDYGGVTKRFVGLIYQSVSSCSVDLSRQIHRSDLDLWVCNHRSTDPSRDVGSRAYVMPSLFPEVGVLLSEVGVLHPFNVGVIVIGFDQVELNIPLCLNVAYDITIASNIRNKVP